jgi:hypothetical protein
MYSDTINTSEENRNKNSSSSKTKAILNTTIFLLEIIQTPKP